MNYRANIREHAEADIEEAAVWYEQQHKGLGDEFLDEVLLSLEMITDNPYLFAEIYRKTHRVGSFEKQIAASKRFCSSNRRYVHKNLTFPPGSITIRITR